MLCNNIPFALAMLSRLPQLFHPELASAAHLLLNVVGAVYGANLAWLEKHGREPPDEVVRSLKRSPRYLQTIKSTTWPLQCQETCCATPPETPFQWPHIVASVYSIRSVGTPGLQAKQSPSTTFMQHDATPSMSTELKTGPQASECSWVIAPQVATWGPLQASHLMEGPLGLRRNFNYYFLTLESEWGNKLRHACAGMLLRKLAGGKLPPDVSVLELDHLAEAQLTGSQPAEGELSLTKGSKMLLSRDA